MRSGITFAQQACGHAANGLDLPRQNAMGGTLGHLEAQPGADPDKVLGIRGKAQAIDNRKLTLVIDKEQT